MPEYTNLKDFPFEYNQSQRATKGTPRSFQIVDDQHVLFLNSVDEKGTLGIYYSELKDDGSLHQEIIIDASNLLDSTDNIELPDEIKALKERLRDLSSGISSFQYSPDADLLVFSLSTDVFLYSLRERRILKSLQNVFLPKLSPNGEYIAVCEEKNLKVFDVSGDRYIKTISQDNYIWGQADFISAEEMGRYTSVWFSPDSKKLVSLGYNDDEVELTEIKDTADGDPRPYKYPFAGTKNPSLLLNEYEIGKDSIFYEVEDEYYVDTVFTKDEAISVTLNREQNKLSTSTGIFEYESYRHIDLFDLIPTQLKNKTWLHYDIDNELDAKHLAIDNKKILGTEHLINVLGFSKSFLYLQTLEDGFNFKIKRIKIKDLEKQKCLKDYRCETIKISNSPITLSLSSKSDSFIITERLSNSVFPQSIFYSNSIEAEFSVLANFDFNFDIASELKTFGDDIRVLITKPNKVTDKLPLLVYSYGGPSSFTSGHIHRYAVSSKQRALIQQWIASLGFVVISVDGAGTPIGTVSREDATSKDFFEATVADQIKAVKECIATENVDENKIAIMGWSFGGYLSAACISKHPEIFKAAVVGAPVTDWALYDTCYTERIIGNPNTSPDNYDRSSLLNKSFSSNSSIRLIHGRSDDNVLYINSQKLETHLKDQGVDVEFITIDNATHMVGNANDAAQLLIDDVLFLSEALNLPELRLLLAE